MKAEINIAMRAEARGRGESKDIIKDARRNKIKDTRRGDDRNETRE